MASLTYLWKQRIKYPIDSAQFYKSWAKRAMTLPGLLKRNQKRNQLLRAGAKIDPTAEIGEAIIEGKKKNLSIGAFSFLGKVNIALHHQVIIGEKVCINDGVHIITATHNIADPLWRHIKKAVTIDDFVWIATGAIILPGVHIARGAVVGAGAVVSKDVAPYQIVAGNPAQAISKTRNTELTYNPCAFLAANNAWLVQQL